MKIKMGFVSNSSTASFLVVFKHTFFVKQENMEKQLLTKKQIAVLKKLDFTRMYANYPEHVKSYFDDIPPIRNAWNKIYEEQYNEMVVKHPTLFTEKSFAKYWKSCENAYGKYVSCNQSDIIIPLFENKIPFVADIHYDQYTIKYDGGNYYYSAPNLGKLMLMACNEPEDKAGKVQRLSVAKYLKEHK